MAWNEPGGNNKPRGDWGGGDQGPPDLDEVLRKLRERLGALLGVKDDGVKGGGANNGGSSGSGGAGGGGLSKGLVATILAVALAVWGLWGFYTVDQQERGVVLRLGKYHSTAQPGLQWNPPIIDDVTVVNVTRLNQATFREQMLTEDENIVEVHLSVQYVISNAEDYVLRVRRPENSLSNATKSALRHEVGSSAMGPILTEGREKLGLDVRERLQRYLDLYQTGISVSKVNVDNAKPPAEVQAAFDDVIKAREDQERVIEEARAYANGIVPEARGQAKRVLEEANAYKERITAEAKGDAARFSSLLTEYQRAPEVTRKRLYLETLQGVMENTSKVVVDVEGGNNILYLPLDRIILDSARPEDEAQPPEGEAEQGAAPPRRDSPVRSSGRGGR